MLKTIAIIAMTLATTACGGSRPASEQAGRSRTVADAPSPELPTDAWVLGTPPAQTIVTLEGARTDEQRRIGVGHRSTYGKADGMALIGHAGRIDLDLSTVKMPYDIAALDDAGMIVRIWEHDGTHSRRIDSERAVSAILFLRKGMLKENAIVEGAKAKMMRVPA